MNSFNLLGLCLLGSAQGWQSWRCEEVAAFMVSHYPWNSMLQPSSELGHGGFVFVFKCCRLLNLVHLIIITENWIKISKTWIQVTNNIGSKRTKEFLTMVKNNLLQERLCSRSTNLLLMKSLHKLPYNSFCHISLCQCKASPPTPPVETPEPTICQQIHLITILITNGIQMRSNPNPIYAESTIKICRVRLSSKYL